MRDSPPVRRDSRYRADCKDGGLGRWSLTSKQMNESPEYQAVQERQRQRERDDQRRVAITFVVSLAASLVIYLVLMWPLAGADVRASRWASLLLAAPLAAGACAAAIGFAKEFIDRRSTFLRYAVAAAVVPVACLVVWAIWLRPAHAVQDDALAVWDRYTSDIALIDRSEAAYVQYRDAKTADICSRTTQNDNFCVTVWTKGSDNDHVMGGYRFTDVNEAGLPIRNECFGSWRGDC